MRKSFDSLTLAHVAASGPKLANFPALAKGLALGHRGRNYRQTGGCTFESEPDIAMHWKRGLTPAGTAAMLDRCSRQLPVREKEDTITTGRVRTESIRKMKRRMTANDGCEPRRN